MVIQQSHLSSFLRANTGSIRELSAKVGINHTRLWRILCADQEMKLSEYLKLLEIYKNVKGWSIDEAFFFLGVHNGSSENITK